MRIAQVAPLIESVPPRFYGGTERVVSYLTEELIRRGHSVTLFASGDSQSAAEVVASVPRALRLSRTADPLSCYVLQLEHVRQRVAEFDLVHFHDNFLHFPLTRERSTIKTVSTLHGRLDLPICKPIFREFPDVPVVSISNHQRAPVPLANWVGTVYHGLPTGAYKFTPCPKGNYVAFVGRLCPEKRPDRAIEIARGAGMKLIIAGKVDAVDEIYFRDCIKPLLNTPEVEFLGEIDEPQKAELIGNASGLLFPIDWPEAFGLVLIEAMACGTPVIAWRCGSVPEVVEHGLTGYIVDSMEGALDAMAELPSLNRAKVRERFEQRFSIQRMTTDYLSIYAELTGSRRKCECELAPMK